MSSEGYSETFFKGPAYALVIGISTYEHGQDAGQPLGQKDFPNLKYAAKDAEDFSSFLKNYGFISYNVRELFNEQASRENIIDKLEELKECCKQPDVTDPLVIVYFSGHGWADSKGRHYLVPYNAERDRLPATGLSNRDFSNHLNEMETTRRVVFIDACHAGAMGMEGAKGELAQYDARNGLGEGDGRYLIASCRPGQQSYEHGNNGIFTGELLRLLKCETDDFTEEEIDIFPLFHALKKKVAAAARLIGKEQEPITDMTGATGIILAINERLKKKRLQDDKEAIEEKHRFLELICNRIKKSDCDQRLTINVTLLKYVREGDRFAGYDDFYGCFDECLKRWGQGESSRLDEWCKLLITAYRYASDSPTSPKESQSQEPSKPVDKFVPERGESKVIGSEASSATRVPTVPSDQQQLRRQLTPEACEYILEEIMTKLKYYSDTRTLREILTRPVSDAEFAQTVNRIGLKKSDSKLDDILQRIVERFYERWDGSKDVESTTLSSLLMQKGKDESGH